MIIRTATEADLNAVHALDKQAFETDYYPFLVLRQLYDVHQEHFKVAYIENNLVGYVLGAFVPANRTAWILAIAVDNDFKGKGIATSLLEMVIEDFIRNNASHILLTVSQHNEEALSLYTKRFSFLVDRLADNYFGVDEHRLILKLDIVNQ